ncbi:Maf family protein [Alkalimarinus coralli]|uniref:Maf family protein n=1 Tax=Alkalimarinus coralli TaxID=2935863 RepID=UPI00202AE773|nr:Maf family protein [Alkalimarinus coralli]
MSTLPLVLASTSPYRKQILEKLCLPFSTAAPNIDESALEGEQPKDMVERVTKAKALAIRHKYPNHLIISSDQIATLDDGTVLTKPNGHENAVKQLNACSGKHVTFLTGLALLNSKTNNHQFVLEPFRVHFRTLTTREIENYLNIEKPYDCAGSFKVEGMGICLFDKLSGDDFNALIGLPLIRLLTLLRNESVNPLS